jgi:hypothetical protein
MLTKCCGCRKVKITTVWYEAAVFAEAANRAALKPGDDIIFTHGYCPECLKREMNKIGKEFEAAEKSSSPVGPAVLHERRQGV